jgi:three-Cys-motif partner protein
MSKRTESDRERLVKHLSWLMDAGGRIAERDSNLPGHPPTYDKGCWTALKLICLKYYIPGYLNILAPRHRVAYVDLFAGPGLNLVGSSRSVPLPGSPMIALMHPGTKHRFSCHLLCDKNEAYCEALGRRVRSWVDEDGHALEADDLVTFNGDANEFARSVPATLKRMGIGHSLVFIDPEGMEFDWQSLKFLVEHLPYSDLIILFPSAGLPRVLGRTDEGALARARRFLGPGSERIGPDSTEEDAMSVYRANLAALGKEISTEIAIVGTGSFHYHLIPAVRKTAAGSPWFSILTDAKDLIEKFDGDIIEVVMDQIDGRMGVL